MGAPRRGAGPGIPAGKAAVALAAIGLAGLLLAPAPAWGQGQTWAGAGIQQMLDTALWRLGVIRANAAFNLANAGYDSDIYYGYLPEKVPDITASASTPVQIILPLSKRAVIDITETPQYVFYLDTRNQRTLNNQVSGRVHLVLDRFYIQAGGGYSDDRRRLSPELDLNVRQKTASLSGLVLWQATKTVSWAVLYGGAQNSYEDIAYFGGSLADRLNRNEEFVDLIAYVQPSTKVRISWDAQYGSFQFRRSEGRNRDAVSYALFAGIEFIPEEMGLAMIRGIQGAASLGYMRLDLRDPGYRDGSGLVGQASVSASLARRTTGQLFLSRGFQFSIYSGGTYYLATRLGAGLTHHLSKRASLGYSFTYGRTSYPDPATGTYYRYLTHDLSLNLSLARSLRMTIHGNFGQRDLGGPSPIRQRFSAGLGLAYGFSGSGISLPSRGGGR